MALWRKSSAALAVVVVGGVVTPGVSVATGQTLQSKSTTVAHACTFEQPSLVYGTSQRTDVSPETVVVQYPATVAPGQVFTAIVQPGSEMRTTNGRAGLLSYDVAFPDQHTTNLGADRSGGGSNMSGTPQVNRIGADGKHQQFGPFVRISGDTTAKLGENARNGDAIDRWNAGLTVPAKSAFQFPGTALTMRARVDAGGNTISVGLKGAGHSSGSSSNGAANTIQGAEQGGYTTARTSYFFCSSSYAGALSSTYVDGSLPTYLARTRTVLTTPNTALPVGTGRTVQLRAEVSTDEELMSNVRDGDARVRFDVTNRSTGVATSTDVRLDENGVAVAPVTFDPPSGSNTREDYEIRATYTGRAGDIASSSSSTATITSAYNERVANVALSSQNGELSGGSMPVTVKADVSMPSGVQFPAGLQVRLYRNDQPIDVITVPAGGTGNKQVVFPTHSLAQAAGTKTYRYRAEVVPLITNNTLDRFTGISSVPVAAIVTGTNPGSTLPEGGGGSADLQNIFLAPKLVWEWLSGSVGRAGAFSTAFN
ncbi:hypothetical protein ACTHQW_11635 [Dietzia maris]